MLNTLSPIAEDLAGQSYHSPHYLQTQRRIRSLIDILQSKNYMNVWKIYRYSLPIPNRVPGNLLIGKRLTAIKLSA